MSVTRIIGTHGFRPSLREEEGLPWRLFFLLCILFLLKIRGARENPLLDPLLIGTRTLPFVLTLSASNVKEVSLCLTCNLVLEI